MDDDGKRQPVDSGMVNEYLREAMGGDNDFTAKDFRTWGGTVRAIAFLACQQRQEPMSQRAFNGCVAATARSVAETLGNTPAVCRKSSYQSGRVRCLEGRDHRQTGAAPVDVAATHGAGRTGVAQASA